MRSGSRCLVGTTSIDKSEFLSSHLLEAQVGLHAQRSERASARARGADCRETRASLAPITIATNMAGRGTDIQLGRQR